MQAPYQPLPVTWSSCLSTPHLGEVGHRCQAHVQGVSVISGLHRGDKRGLVGSLALATLVGIVNLLPPLQGVGLIALQHVLEQLSGFVGHAQLEAPCQGTDGAFVLRQQVHGQEALGQWRLGVLYHCARNAGAMVAIQETLSQQPPQFSSFAWGFSA